MLLGLYAIACILFCAVAASAGGTVAVGPLMLVSLFMSIMFPTIFALGVETLGEARPLGSSFIIGEAIFPPLMGFVSVEAAAMLLPLACFVVVAIYARRVSAAGAG